jgi:hypothetical protein
MSREIKFRGLTVENKWAVGLLAESAGFLPEENQRRTSMASAVYAGQNKNDNILKINAKIMKQFLFIAFLFCSSLGYGQVSHRYDTAYIHGFLFITDAHPEMGYDGTWWAIFWMNRQADSLMRATLKNPLPYPNICKNKEDLWHMVDSLRTNGGRFCTDPTIIHWPDSTSKSDSVYYLRLYTK